MTAPRTRDPDVLVVGAGPVGLTLALALGRRGVRCLLIERSETPGALPKMDLTNPRSMEILGRLGLAEKIRRAGWPLDARFDVYGGCSLVEPPWAVLEYPSIREMQALIAESDDGAQPREPYERISQYTLEDLLRREVQALRHVEICFGHELVAFDERGDEVVATARGCEGRTIDVRAKYLVGCDGGASTVRRELNIGCSGPSAVGRMFMIFFRAPDLLARSKLPPFRHYMLAGDRPGTLVAQDDLERWALHLSIAPEADPAKLDPVAEIHAALGLPLDVEVLHSGAWSPHLLVADSFGRGRAFLAGDAAHQYIPTGGFGMNTGIGDADNLAWKLAAVLQGWGGPGLLASYEDERRPVALRNCRASEYAAAGVGAWRALATPAIRAEGVEGERARQRLAAAFNTYQRRSHEQRGIELGYRYTHSEICLHAPEALPDPDSPAYAPCAAPGTRLPHAWLDSRVSVHDRAGPDLTLLALDAEDRDVGAFALAAAELDVPLKIELIDGRPDLAALYGARLILLRPDMHVGWRGDEAGSAAQVLSICAGHVRPAAEARLRQSLHA